MADLKQTAKITAVTAAVTLLIASTWAYSSDQLSDRYTGTQAKQDRSELQRDLGDIKISIDGLRSLLIQHETKKAHDGQAVDTAIQQEKNIVIAQRQKEILAELRDIEALLRQLLAASHDHES